MVASSILPVSIHNGKLFFLFGKENQMEDSAKGFSDFGGGVEGNESLLQTAYREGSEELSGFLGNESDLQKLVKKNGGFYSIHHKEHQYHIHIFFLEYNEELPRYFTNHHQFVWKRMNRDFLNDSKLFEKQEIRWFSTKELRTKKGEFRSFYQSIVDELITELPNIENFIMKKGKKKGTRKLKGGN
jgi:ADP-ribose pyrophosphatase YjhB (NUDIX family)